MGNESFVLSFLAGSFLSALVAVAVFTIPGYFVALAVAAHKERENFLSLLLLSPALGLATYGIFSLLFNYIFSLTHFNIVLSWLVFSLSWFFFARKSHGIHYPQIAVFRIPFFLLLLGASLISAIPAFGIFPVVKANGLFVGNYILDHVKIALVDAIAREGLPPLSPYYAPAGERIELIYYYGWHYLVALVKMISGATAWQAEVAMIWFTAFAALTSLLAITIRLSENIRSGFFILLLSMTFSLRRVFYLFANNYWRDTVLAPPTHGFQHFLKQMAWAPQHVFSALCVILLFFVTVQFLRQGKPRLSQSICIGLLLAQAVSSSVYVGGIALAMAVPFILFSIKKYLFFRGWLKKLLPALIWALIIGVLFALPVLQSSVSGPEAGDVGPLLSLRPHLSVPWFGLTTPLEYAGHIVLYWILYLPLELGVIFIFGVLAIIFYKPVKQEERIFYNLSFAAILAYLLAVQFVQSSIMNNDFGWRSIMVPILLLEIWIAVLLSKLRVGKFFAKDQIRSFSSIIRPKNVLIPCFWILLGFTISINFNAWYIPGPNRSRVKNDLQQHAGLLETRYGWDKIRELTRPDDLVQFNPLNYGKTLTRNNQPMQQALFADRPVAFASFETANVYTHSYSKAEKRRQGKIVRDLFAANPTFDNIRYAHDILRIKALLVNVRDPVWHDIDALEKTDDYVLSSSTDTYRIYLAKEMVVSRK